LKLYHSPSGPAAVLSSRRTTLNQKDRLIFDTIAYENYKAAMKDIDGNDKPNFEAIFSGNTLEGLSFFKKVYAQFENLSNGEVHSVINSGALDANIIQDTSSITIDDDDE
jgi:hypothetical protein